MWQRTATQITPEEYLLMKPIVSGVANSAAMIKSPSFSRSSSSVTTMILPALTASTWLPDKRLGPELRQLDRVLRNERGR